MFPEHMLSVRATVEPGREAEFNRWYAFESAAQLAAALSGPEIKELTKLYDRDIGAFSTRVRTTYERVLLQRKT